MPIDENFIDELNDRLDIVDIVSRYVQLEQKGGRYWGCCPFHNEKTPSFAVTKDKKMFYCFGCREGGGIISFIQKQERLSFGEAVEYLAKIAGMEIPKDDRTANIYKRKQTLLNLNKAAAKYYFELLETPVAEKAREYIKKRQLTPKTVRHFGLGYSADSWTGLTDEMVKKGYTKTDLLEAGLAVKGKNGGVYDRFRNRLMFPIIDISGNVLGFGGRVLDDSLPKYLNSPESFLYHKANHLYAMNFAKHTNEQNIILAEGYMDVIALHQAGFTNTVASLGTSLTSEQAELIKKRVKEVIIAYDGDEAGQKATARAIEIFNTKEIKAKVLRVKDAKDPDEYIKKFGSEAFRLLMSGSENSADYKLAKIRGKYDISNDEQRIAFVHEAIEMAANLPTGIEIEVYMAKIAEISGIRRETIENEIKRLISGDRKKKEKKEIRDQKRPENLIQPIERTLRYKNVALSRAVEGLIAVISQNIEMALNIKDEIDTSLWEKASADILAAVIKRAEQGKTINPDLMTSELDEGERKLLASIMAGELAHGSPSVLIKDYMSVIRLECAKIKAEKGIEGGLQELLELKRRNNKYGGQ